MSAPRPIGRLHSIDVLRGIAVLVVVLHHLPFSWAVSGAPDATGAHAALPPSVTQWTHYGQYGVHLFLVISGFCIHLPWARVGDRGHTIDFVPFWRRRLRRLYPPYLVALGATLAGSFLAFGVAQHGVSRGVAAAFGYASVGLLVTDVVLHLALLQNFTQAPWRIGNGPFWTLALEEQLYLLYFAFLALRRRSSAPRAVLVAFLVTLGFRLATPWLEDWVPIEWLHLGPSRWFEWTLGALAVEAHHGLVRLPAWLRWRSTFALALAFAFLCDPPELWAGRWTGLPLLADLAFGLAFFVLVHRWVFAEPELEGRHHPMARLFGRLGVESYSVYLVHQPLLFVGKRLSMAFGASLVGILVARFVAGVGGGLVFHRLVERRFLASARDRARGAASRA
ncbi:MAG: acyltransferase [Polyangiales bacterium]